MKKLFLYLLTLCFIMISCKKDAVDASSTKAFQESINDMASSLTTLQQEKFNEALYILKTFGVEGNSDIERLNLLGKMLNGKKVPEIMAMADKIAQENDVKWSSTAPPSLGTMNIFGDLSPAETDHNDIKASALQLSVNPYITDENGGASSFQIIPRLVDSKGAIVEFSGATLETIMEVYSNGMKIYTSKNLMQDNQFGGFSLKAASLPVGKVFNNEIDISVSVKTTSKTHKMTKVGLKLNPDALQKPKVEEELVTDTLPPASVEEEVVAPSTGAKTTVSAFLSHLSSQNFRGAYSKSENPAWGSYEAFSNPTTGFGGVKNINIKKISENSVNSSTANVSASYDVVDKDGKTTPLNVSFGLKNIDGEWKIVSYKIN